jgi:hypothetical protein
MLKKIASATAGLVMLAAGAAPARADTNYGAIATSAGYYGTASNEDSKSEAQRTALKHCREAVRKDDAHEECAVRVWFTKCGAVVQNERLVAWGIGNTEGEAVRAARTKIHRDGQVYAKLCNDNDND